MKKVYEKPIILNDSNKGTAIIPAALAAGAALAGGYVIGRVAKSVEVRQFELKVKSLEKVCPV